jgi:hypothetical protein
VADKPNSAAAEIAREANSHILALEERLGLQEVSVHCRDGDLIGLFCECGCLRHVATTRADYAANGGVWIEGHKP